jgi:hypothetical protein
VIREEAAGRVRRNAELMLRKHGKGDRVQEYEPDRLVGVLVPEKDRKKHSSNTIPGIVVETKKKTGLMRVRSVPSDSTRVR